MSLFISEAVISSSFATNRLEFFLRNLLSWRRPGRVRDDALDLRLGQEIVEWLNGFQWRGLLLSSQPIVADIGAKNFFLAPALDAFLREQGYNPELHGIEIDAHRRYRNLFTRADYGRHYAARIPRGEFHALDFLHWQRPLDLALLLNPFVTEGPLRAWGLPRKHFQPRALFAQIRRCLEVRGGKLLVCSPSEQEFSIAVRLAEENGLKLLMRHDWRPKESSLQRKPRLGGVFH